MDSGHLCQYIDRDQERETRPRRVDVIDHSSDEEDLPRHGVIHMIHGCSESGSKVDHRAARREEGHHHHALQLGQKRTRDSDVQLISFSDADLDGSWSPTTMPSLSL